MITKQQSSLSAIRKWNNAHALLMTLCIVIEFFIPSQLRVMSIVALASMLFFLFKHHPTNVYRIGGPANWITLMRLLMLIGLTVFHTELDWLEIGGWLIAIVLFDGVDGYLARRFGTESEFGSYFDMETDSLFVAFGCALLFFYGSAPAWVLIAGVLRYPYCLLVYVLGWSSIAERRFKLAKFIAVVFFISIIANFLIDHQAAKWLINVSSLCVLFSFSRSLFFLWLDQRQFEKA